VHKERWRNRLFPQALSLFEGPDHGQSGFAKDGTAGSVPFLGLIVLGPPGSGKGTQAGLLSEELTLPHISTGAILRDRILVGDAFGRAIAERIDVGQFVPDEWINRILDERLAMADCRPGIILDGYPRTLAQAERLVGQLQARHGVTLVIRLDAQAETLARRFAGRRQCSECGALFHLRYQPSLAGDCCDRPGCAGLLVERPDDRPEYVSGRLADFERLTAPVMSYLEPRVAGLTRVDAGAGSPDEVLARILAGLEFLLASPNAGSRQDNPSATRWRDGGALASPSGRD
jgi:adenylate kinase